MQRNREAFLHHPEPRETPNPQAMAAAEAAAEALRRAALTQTREMITEEARASAYIESEYDEEEIARHAGALESYLLEPKGQDEESLLLDLHRRMMRNQAHAQPGRYRTFGVTIGDWRPPGAGLVPALMREFHDGGWRRAGGQDGDAAARAIRAHVHFETVHPFADGNGRTGRALLQRMLGTRIPISPFILRERWEYYRLFEEGDWSDWVLWLSRGIVEQAGSNR